MRLVRFILVICSILFLLPRASYAYPNEEIIGSSGTNPLFDFGLSTTFSSFFLVSDIRLIVSYGETIKFVDMGKYALEATQPAALSTTDETDGVISDVAYSSSRNEMYASQEDGDLLIYNLTTVTTKPNSITVLDAAKLGPMVIDDTADFAYISDNTNRKIHVVDLIAREVKTSQQMSITGNTSFVVTDGIFVNKNDSAYFTTDAGTIFIVPSGGASISSLNIGTGKSLTALASFPNEDYMYVVDKTTPQVVKVALPGNSIAVTGIDISENPDATGIAIVDVTNPNSTYAFVAGALGVSIINVNGDEVLDMGTNPDKAREPLATQNVPYLLSASSSTDAYVYMGTTTAKVGILSDRPWIEITSLTYSNGGTKMGIGESATIKFTSDMDGTYKLMSGGTQAATGTLLKDSTGQTEGTVTAATEKEVTINYNDNSTAFVEGNNDLWVFVTSSTLQGRRATTLSVDTPPGVVSIRTAGFGNNRIHVTVVRLTDADMSKYRFYAATDEQTALTMATATTEMAQVTSGETQTADVAGLTNGQLYYVAVDAVDAAGNVSASRSVASATPSATEGPAGLMGEQGCSLVEGAEATNHELYFILFLAFVSLTIFRLSLRAKSRWRVLAIIFFVTSTLFVSSISFAQGNITEQNVTPTATDEYVGTPQLFEVELKGGFWMPKSSVLDKVFTKCCNIITRVQGGALIAKRYGVGAGVGVLYKTANALGTGVNSGQQSSDRFSFLLVPFELNFTWRADYFSWRYLIPYVRTGLDYVFFRESVSGGSTTKGLKLGAHGGGGLMINIGEISDAKRDLDADLGMNDLFLTLEAVYQWINNFGGSGLDLSGPVYSFGVLFEF